MRPIYFALFLVLVMLPFTVFADTSRAADLTVHVASFHITSVSEEKAEAEIDVTVQTDVDAQLEHLDLVNLHANGVPFFAQPIDAPIELRRGEATQLPPLSVVVYFHDVDSLQPLIEILEQEQTRLKAEVNVIIHATTLQRLFLGSARPMVVVPIDQMVDVQAPGGFLGRTSALAVLKVAQIALAGTERLRRSDGKDPMWNTQVAAMRTGLLHARSCFAVQRKRPEDDSCVDELAFIAGSQVISSAELGAPWRFNATLARSVADRGGRIQKDDPRITVEGNPESSYGERSGSERGFVAVVAFHPIGDAPTVQKIIFPSRSKLDIANGEAPGVYGKLKLQETNADGFTTASQAVRNSGRWNDLAVLRLVHLDNTGRWTAKMIFLSGTASGNAITFSRAVDHLAIGSPILTPQGVIGVVQGEKGGTLLSSQ